MTASHPVFKPVTLPDFQNGNDTLEQLQEMLVCLIVGKQLTAIDSAIEYVVPTILYGNAQGTTHSGRLSAYPALPVKFNVDC